MARSAEDALATASRATTLVISTASARFSPTTSTRRSSRRSAASRARMPGSRRRRPGTSFPDEHGTITGVYTSGDTVAIELSWEGTQSGPIATPDGQVLPASNKRISVKSVEVIEVEEGKLKSLRHYFDLMTLLKQIGAMDHADAAIASRLHSASGS